MAFVNLSLLLGTALIGVPIALHLVMRQKPKQLVFPAIRFIQKRHETNRRTLRLRHFLLLLLRCLLIAFCALALARPSVNSNQLGNWLVIAALSAFLVLLGVLMTAAILSRRGRLTNGCLAAVMLITLAAWITMLVTTLGQDEPAPAGDREAPVAAVMVIDSSPRMQYRYENHSRVEIAQDTADWMIRQLPPDSQVGVLDSRAISPVFSIDNAAARKMLQRVRTAFAPQPLDQLVLAALQLVEESDIPRKEIYLFTDLTVGAWQIDDRQQLTSRLEEAKDVAIYLIDVGIEEPANFALEPLQLGSQSLPKNDSLDVTTSISCVGPGGKRTVELLLEDFDPTLPVERDGKIVLPESRVVDRREVELTKDGSERLEFRLPALTEGIRQGQLRIIGQDGLAVDDHRTFTVRVREPWRVLVAAPSEVNTSAFVEAISPSEFRLEGRAPFECVLVDPEELPDRTLTEYSAVVLLDPPPLSESALNHLATYLRDGGSLAMFLGPQAVSREAFSANGAAELLPGKLGYQYRVPGRGVYLAPHSYEHPILQPFRAIATSVPWDQFPVFRHWSLTELSPDAHVLLRYGNDQAAIVERMVGQGIVITMTTPISELDQPVGRQSWNELASPDGWPRFVLVNQIARYLTGQDSEKFNYESGQLVTLDNSDDQYPRRYVLFSPSGESRIVQARDRRLVVKTTDEPGAYRLKGNSTEPLLRGYSISLPSGASRLDRVETTQLDECLGKERYQLARQRDQIIRVQGRQRSGQEFYPLLILLLAVTFLMEHVFSNRFYRDTEPVAR